MTSRRPPATAQKPTPHAAATHQGTPVRQAPATQAITPPQRQRAYRQRTKGALSQAIGDEANASRVTLLTLLGYDLALLDQDTATSMHSAARNSARRVINALVTRYGIDLEG